MVKTLTFSSRGKNYTVTHESIFMDNGAVIMFIEKGKNESVYAQRVHVSAKEWQRIKSHLTAVDYEAYYGHKPLMSGVSIYQIK